MRSFGACTAVAILMCIPSSARAAEIFSNGTGGGDWNSGSTWEGGVVPVAEDHVGILAGDSITISSGQTVTRIGTTNVSLTPTPGSLTISANATLINVSLTSSNNLGTLTVEQGGTFNNKGFFYLDGTTVIDGQLTIESVGQLYPRNNVNISGRMDIETDCYFYLGPDSAPSVVTLESGGVIHNRGNLPVGGSPSSVCELRSEPDSLITNGPTGFLQAIYGDIVSAGVIVNDGSLQVHVASLEINNPGAGPADGVLINRESGTIWMSAGQLNVESNATLMNEGLADLAGTVLIDENGTFSNPSGHVRVGFLYGLSSMNIAGGAIPGQFINGPCGRFSNYTTGTIVNDGVFSSCGIIDGLTGVAGIGGSGTLDLTACGGGTPDATVEIQVTDAGSGNPLPDAQVFLQRVCLPLGTRVPFFDVSGGSANFFLDAVEPSQYEIKAFTPGYSPFSSRVVTVQSAEDVVEEVALSPNPNAVNTLKVDIAVGTGGNLITTNFQVTQNSGTPFQPIVTLDGLNMNLVGLSFGATQADALVEGFTVTPANVTFLQAAPGTLTSSESASSVGDSGMASGSLVFAVAPPAVTGFKVHFKRKTSGGQAPVAGQPISGADHVFGSAFFVPTGNPAVFNYAVEVNAARYYVVLANDQNTIISNVPEVDVAELPATTNVPALNISLPSDDTDGDGLPNAWETSHGLNASSSTSPNGAEHDAEPDGLLNIEEYTLDIHPGVVDTDGDGHPDGFERYAGSNPKVADSPPLMTEVFVRKDFAEPIKVGTAIRPVATIAAANGRVAHGGTMRFQNPGGTVIAFPGAMTLGTGNKAMTLRIDNPTGPRVRIGGTN